mgnify:FL=1
MYFVTVKFNRRTAVCIILAVAALLIGLILLFSHGDDESTFGSKKLETTEERVAYLQKLGWEVDADSETEKDVLIPRAFTGVYQEYNKLQKQQGFDLENYCGTEVQMYTYVVTNYTGNDTVIAALYTSKGRLIAGDIHSTSLDGFMHALK